MLEVVFTESAYASFRLGQREGRFENVYSFVMHLGTGDIANITPSNYEDLEQLIQKLNSGDDIRVWYSSIPDELCGFYWLMDRLRILSNTHGKIYAIKQPQFDETDESIKSPVGWGEVDPLDIYKYISIAELISDPMRRLIGNLWKEIQYENAPIRAEVNGWLCSVPESFYDSYIEKEIDRQPNVFYEAVLIGEVIGRNMLGISDSFIHQRIESMIEKGHIEVEKQAETSGYRRYLRKMHTKSEE